MKEAIRLGFVAGVLAIGWQLSDLAFETLYFAFFMYYAFFLLGQKYKLQYLRIASLLQMSLLLGWRIGFNVAENVLMLEEMPYADILGIVLHGSGMFFGIALWPLAAVLGNVVRLASVLFVSTDIVGLGLLVDRLIDVPFALFGTLSLFAVVLNYGSLISLVFLLHKAAKNL